MINVEFLQCSALPSRLERRRDLVIQFSRVLITGAEFIHYKSQQLLKHPGSREMFHLFCTFHFCSHKKNYFLPPLQLQSCAKPSFPLNRDVLEGSWKGGVAFCPPSKGRKFSEGVNIITPVPSLPLKQWNPSEVVIGHQNSTWGEGIDPAKTSPSYRCPTLWMEKRPCCLLDFAPVNQLDRRTWDLREGFTVNFCAFPKVEDVLSKPIDWWSGSYWQEGSIFS